MPGTDLTPAPWWTPWPGTGPGAELLGDLTGRRLIELGCGHGNNAAAFAMDGATVEAIDVAQEAIATARARWGHLPRLQFIRADAASYLSDNDRPTYDVVCSIFGALRSSGPPLMGLVARRLRPGGLVAISARLAAGHAQAADDWAALVTAFGFTRDWTVVPDPDKPSSAPCLVFTAERSS